MRTSTYLSLFLGAWILAVASAAGPVDSLQRDLKSPVVSVRLQAVKSLAATEGQGAVAGLTAALGDSEASVRREAAKALGAIKEPRATSALIAALDDRDANVRMYAAYALGEIRAPEAVGRLVVALNDSQWCVREQAAWALREIGDSSIIGPLVATLKTAKADVEQVLWILKDLDAEKANEHLARLLEDSETLVRLRAVGALGKLQTSETIGPLTKALTDADVKIRRRTVEALAALGDRRAEQPLLELAAREPDADLRELAERVALDLSMHEHLDAYWSFDDQSTSVAKDMTGHGSDGEIRGAVPVPGKKGYALRFGPGKFVELGKPAALPIANTAFTVMAWVQPEAPDGVVVARGGAFCGYSLYLMEGIPKFGIRRLKEEPTQIAAGSNRLGDSWSHLAGVVKEDRIELYVNGRLAATAKTAGFIPGNCGQGMEIGFDAANSPAEIVDAFQGTIDEVKVFRAALPAEEILEEAGLPLQESRKKP
ncbi:MAG: hypothetical protein GXX96_38305 [Planctomycetaceae bacterium]|nr:hypothetical protein [Planctomycetaceae bacterium]